MHKIAKIKLKKISSSSQLKGQLTWDQLLERRQKNARLLPTRTSNVKCPGGFVEFDEFNCLSTFLYERYQSSELNRSPFY